MKSERKTNAMRLLDQARIKYETYYYSIEDEVFSGELVSEKIGVAKEECFKTLSLKCDRDLYILCIPVNQTIDLKKSAREIGVKHLEMIKVKDLLKEVGYQRGETTPIGILKKHKVYFDKTVLDHEQIEISGGKLGVSLKLNAQELLNFVKAEVKDLCEEKI